ncbi:MAG: choice-of-anchor J domain-containing protein [Saprospiraceae bacterium]|nr:choice-of-anchor J domain-containing protein [Saprospiraceae bacterium]
MNNLIKFFLPTLFLGLVFSACIKEDFDQPPVDGTDPGLTANATIAQLKALHSLGELETISEDWIIKATVVADDASGNLYQAFVIQDETGGIMVKIETADSYTLYPVGREVYVKCKGLVLGDYENLIQLGGFVTDDGQLGNIIKISDHLVRGKKGTPPVPNVKKISELTFDDVNTLVTVTDVQFVLADTFRTYADPVTRTTYNRNLEDCDGVGLLVRTSGYASFAGVSLPDGGGTLTGILGIFRDDLQFLVRDLNDVNMSGERCSGPVGPDPCAGGPVPIVAGVDEDFDALIDYDPVTLNGWTNIALQGTRVWQAREFSGNVYAQATAYNDSSPTMDTWLISPRIDLTTPLVLTFETAKSFYTHDGLTVWYSTDFECDPTAATWVPLPATIAKQSDPDNAFIPSGDVDLSALVGQKVAIGFHYVGGSGSGQTGTFRVDNIKLGMGGGNPDPCNGVTAPTVGFLMRILRVERPTTLLSKLAGPTSPWWVQSNGFIGILVEIRSCKLLHIKALKQPWRLGL